ncbi:ABC transporter substrate-binding protein [Amycolatopsis jejuensis]|uniref:ABC transporter substrate-binding protein n=1 Tax=Amycolatopsis jejuensis TaxID=330084 RepID=UPI0005279E00|nr:ABC transporter substrate-binding protein [Amycolatopsis jejuensis]
MKRTPRSALVMTALAAMAAVVTGCSSSRGGTDPAAKLTGPPLTVGFVNTDSGALPYPEISSAAQIAADQVNATGGIGGRPLKLDVCSTDGSPARAVQCANKFVADRVPAVLSGIEVSLSAALPILDQAGITVFGHQAVPDVYRDPKAVMLSAPLALSLKIIMYTLKNANVHHLVAMLPNAGAAFKQQFDEGIKPLAEQFGITSTLTSTAPVNPDVTSAFTAAKAANADGVFLLYAENDCTNAIRAARSTGFTGVVYAVACQKFLPTLGSQAAGVYTTSLVYPYNGLASVSDPKAKAQLAEYNDVMTAAKQAKNVNTNAPAGFSIVMTLAAIAKDLKGEVTATSLGDAIAKFRGEYYMGGTVDCAQRPMPGATCGTGIAVLKANSDGTQQVVGGKFTYAADIK